MTWALIGVTGLAVAALLAGLALLQTDWGREHVRRFALERLRGAVDGRVELARLGGNLLGGLALRDVVITGPGGEPFLSVARLDVDYDLSGFLRQEILLGEVRLVEPRIVLRQDSAGRWNYERIFAREQPEPPPSGGWGSVVRIGELRIVDGSVLVVSEAGARPLGPLGRRAELESVSGTLELELSRTDETDLRRLGAEDLSFVLREPRLAVRELDVRARSRREGLDLERFLLRTPATELSASGTVRDLAQPVVDLALRADPVALEEVRRFTDALPWNGTLRGSAQVEGPSDSLSVRLRDVALRTPRSAADAEGTVTLGETPLFEGRVALAPLDPLEARAAWPAWPLEEALRATLSARGSAERTALEAELAFGETRATLEGTLGLAGGETVYDLRGAVKALDLADVTGDPGWRSRVNGELRAAGSGRAADLQGSVRETNVRGYRVVSASLGGRVAGDVLRIDELAVQLPRSRVRASGSVPLEGPLDVTFSAVSRDLSDFRPDAAPMPVGGLEVRGTARGPRAALSVAAEVHADSLAAGGVVVDSLSATALLSGLGGPAMRAVARGSAGGIAAPGGVTLRTATFETSFAGDSGEASIAGRVDSLRTTAAHAHILLGEPSPAVVLDSLVFARGGQVWALQEPGRLVYQDGRVAFDAFVVAHDGQRLSLEGVLDLEGRQDLRFALDSLSVADLQRLAGREPAATGILRGSGTLHGTARAPVLESELALTGAEAGGVSIRRVEGTLGYADRRLALGVTLVPDSAGGVSADEMGALVLEGTVPVDLGFTGVGRRFPDEPIDLRVESRELRLAALAPIGADSAAAPGPVSLDLRVTGRPSAPLLAGSFAVGRSRVGGVALERLQGRIGYDQRQLELEGELVPAVSAQGPSTAAAGVGEPGVTAGAVVFEASLPVDLSLEAVERRLLERPIEVRVQGRDLTLEVLEALSPRVTSATGPLTLEVRLTGTPAEPRYDGELAVRGGSLQVGREGPRYAGIDATVRFDNERIALQELRVESPEGEAHATGEIALRDLTLGDVEAELTARRFTLLDEDGKLLVVDADLDVSGTTQGPAITGSVDVEQLTWPLPEGGTDKDVIDVDEAILYVRAQGDTAAAAPPPDVWRQTLLDLDVHVEDDAVLRSDKALIVIAGDLSVEKPRGAAQSSIAGSLRVLRGTYQDFGRRFEVARGEVFFFGTPELDPGLDVVATTTVENEDTNADVAITLTLSGTVSDLAFDVSSTPAYARSEIFSLLLFGTPSPAAGQEERFESTLTRVASSQAAAPLQRALASELGLDVVEIRPGIGGRETGFLAGKYVAPDVFITYSQDTGPDPESAFGIQYRLSDQWTLQTQAGTQQFGADLFYEFRY
ncbi:MAG: translocation/assembly module TamB domain-containing protein [Gemmatimonadota bacterium]